MHYLKCNVCGHLNEMKSEYLIFCSNCNKKLENNFRDWEKKNPEKTMDDFKKLICVSETDLLETTKDSKSKPKGLILWQVLVAYQTNDEIGKIAAKRVIESVELNENAI